MALNFEAKKAVVEQVNAVAIGAVSVGAAEYRGLNVEQMTNLRNSALEADVSLRVVKNTLAKRALAETECECITPVLSGPVILGFSQEDPGAVARVFRDFIKENEDLIVGFGSTSKITYAGAGIGFIALSQSNQESFLPFYSALIIGPDKINQIRHVKFFQENDLKKHMSKHADLIRPKFELVQKWLHGQDYGSWTKPTGGYFVLLKTDPGLAKRIISLASELGLKLTPAGSTHPYGVDPEDQYIRIAPTACSIEELDSAMEILVCCLGLAYQENERN